MDKLKIKGGKTNLPDKFTSAVPKRRFAVDLRFLLTRERVTLTNMPLLSDIRSMNLLLEQLGTKNRQPRRSHRRQPVQSIFLYQTAQPGKSGRPL